MELDLSEYDQVDEIKFIRESQNQLGNAAGLSSKFATSSSCSDQATLEEANYENDFVFLTMPEQASVRVQQASQQARIATQVPGSQASNPTAPNNQSLQQPSTCSHQQVSPSVTRALMAIQTDNVSNNPFGNIRARSFAGEDDVCQLQRTTASMKSESCISKPFGLLEVCPNTAGSHNKLADLMRQIVTKSDLIYIAIPCAYCHEQIVCPPSDISSWLDHMSCQHNCKLCPICNKMIGLGPTRAIDIMKRHVLEHLDDDWLERRATKVNFSFGLQQQWFSGSRCSVRDER